MWSPAVLRIVAAVCAYESVALLKGSPLPTITSLSRQSLIFRAVVLGGLAYHFRRVAKEIATPGEVVLSPQSPCPLRGPGLSVGRRAT